jgi:hypothetical protein
LLFFNIAALREETGLNSYRLPSSIVCCTLDLNSRNIYSGLHMESQSREKVDISRILIHSVDGSASTARVSSMEAANSVLQSWAHDRSGTLPAECEVEIVFEDGLRYRSHYQLKKQEKSVSLNRHIRGQLAAMTKARRTKRVGHPTTDSTLFPDKPDTAESAKAMLARYNI